MEQDRRSFLSRTIGVTVGAALHATSVAGLVGVNTAIAKTTPVSTTIPRTERIEPAQEQKWQEVSNAKESRRLRMINVHTREKISVVYHNADGYVPDALMQINFLLRDYRANEVMQIDSATIEYLYRIYSLMDTDAHIQILSGYRSPATNEMLRKRSNRVAKNSLHIVGKAVDFRIPGCQTKKLQMAALDLKLGGIGYYGKSDFVHIDSGHFRQWTGKAKS